MLYMFVIPFFSSPILGVEKSKYLISRRPILVVCKQNRAAGGRDATHLPKRCYGHFQPLQPTFVPVAVMTTIRHDYMVK